MSRPQRSAAIVVGSILLVVLSAGPASAHPLGNFTTNHYDGLTITSSSITDSAVVDTAEIPTSQQRPTVDTDDDGRVSSTEAAAYAVSRCAAVAEDIALNVDNKPVHWTVRHSSFAYRPGAAGLQTSRLQCTLTASADLTQRATLAIADRYQGDRVGWHEITAVGQGVHLDHSPVPQRSVSNALRTYPNALLSSPLDVRTAHISVLPGPGTSTLAATIAQVPGAGPVARGLDTLNRAFNDLVGSKHLGLGVGLLAVLLSILLGASHAALPGHGKTVMAAYIAGRSGSKRDALTVGATVTLTHTAGVLLLGLALTLSVSLAGERITQELGLVSGLLLVVVGLGLLRTAIRDRQRGDDHRHNDAPHGQDHDHDHSHGHSHGLGGPGQAPGGRRLSRAGLVGMGIAGGLVPSPSALVVLLGAIALGRTVFGVVLVLGYGIGMAATLTAAGLLLVRLRGRFDRRSLRSRFRFAGRVAGTLPIATAALVVIVGVSLAARGAVPTL